MDQLNCLLVEENPLVVLDPLPRQEIARNHLQQQIIVKLVDQDHQCLHQIANQVYQFKIVNQVYHLRISLVFLHKVNLVHLLQIVDLVCHLELALVLLPHHHLETILCLRPLHVGMRHRHHLEEVHHHHLPTDQVRHLFHREDHYLKQLPEVDHPLHHHLLQGLIYLHPHHQVVQVHHPHHQVEV